MLIYLPQILPTFCVPRHWKMFHWLELILCPDCWDSWENYMTAVRISGPWDQSYQLSVWKKQDRADAFLLTANLKNLIVSKGVGLIPRSARSPEIGNDNMLQYSCLENSRDRGAWKTIVHEVSKSRPWQSNWACTHTRERKWRSSWFQVH